MKPGQLYEKFMITGMVPGFEPIDVGRASGAILVDRDGTEYLDAFSGISVTNVGHGHPEIVRAATRQMNELIHCCTYLYYNPRAGELARKLAEITPGSLQKSFFANSGAEAVEGALRLAKRHTGKREIVALTHGFHGRTVGTLSITGNRSRKRGGGPYAAGVAFAPAPYFYRCPFQSKTEEECAERSAEALRETLRWQTSGDVAAVVVEPILGEGGILVPHDRYLTLVKEILREEDILLIIDEVQTGFGRTGKMFAVEHSGVVPDLMTMAKGIAGGLPLGAFTATSDIAAAFEPGDHLSTFGGNPVSCAAALANIDVLEKEGLPERAARCGDWILSRLREIMPKCPLVGEVRGRGLMIGIELVKDRNKTPAPEYAHEIRKRCRTSGVLVGMGGSFGNVIRLQPPLVIDETQTEKLVGILGLHLSAL